MLHGYTDSDWMGIIVEWKSTSKHFFLGSAMISWSSGKQGSISQRNAEAEYIVASASSIKVVCLRKILLDLISVELEPTVIHCDNQIYINIYNNHVFHDRLKHIEMRYHYVRDMVHKNILSIRYVSTAEQNANILTKPLSLKKFLYF
jgi:hypothetical protein